ncbi:hypothetical protein SK128_023114 [Halocaridina rubra]|uniref:Uncharacterized protein n=1 Tax=Halocaridina rubra TaxID=373956 RepID=A0AAN9AAP0_HALRR
MWQRDPGGTKVFCLILQHLETFMWKHDLGGSIAFCLIFQDLETFMWHRGQRGTIMFCLIFQDLDTFNWQHDLDGTIVFCLVFQNLEIFMWQHDLDGTIVFCLIFQHLESFMWQRDPGGIANKSGGEKTTLQKRKEKEARAKLRADLKRRVAELLEKLKTGEDLQETVLDGECLVNDVKEAEISEKILCRLLVGLGIALPKCGRPEDAIAILTDAVHIARANEYSDEEHSGVEQLGKILAEQGRHAEAVAVWERRISSASNSAQRASLFLLIAKSYFGKEVA